MEILRPSHRVKLVDLQTGGLRRSGMVLLSGQRITETVNAPPSRRCIPTQFAVLEELSHINHVFGLREYFVRRRSRHGHQIARCGESRLVLKAVYTAVREDLELRDGRSTGSLGSSAHSHSAAHAEHSAHLGTGIGHVKTEILRSGLRNSKGSLCHTSATDITNLCEVDPVVAALEPIGCRSRGLSESASRYSDDRQAVYGDRLGESILDPGESVLLIGGKKRGITHVPVGKLLESEVATACGQYGSEFSGTLLTVRKFDGDDGNIFVEFHIGSGSAARYTGILEGSGIIVRSGELDVDLFSSVSIYRSPNQTFHGVFGFNPRASRRRPSGSRSYSELKTEGIGNLD